MLRRSHVAAGALAAILLAAGQTAFAVSPVEKYMDRDAEWYHSDEAARLAANILSWQAPEGGWPKNVDTISAPYTGDTSKLHSTFDNGSTTFELRYLARIYNATHEARYQQTFLRGLDHILKAQYPTGGWPQYYPPGTNYSHYITFNDGAMERLMWLVRDVSRDDQFSFVDADRRKACAAAWDRGIDCILKCQVRVNGQLTGWCAQHDEHDYSPRPARTFELVSLSGAEAVGIVHLLMSIDHPSPEVINSVNAACAWFEKSKLPGIRIEDRKQAGTPRGFQRYVVQDPSAPSMWARFYDIKTNQPIFSDRDGIARANLSDLGIERRTGYKWLGYWPQELLAKDYPAWKARISAQASAKP